MSDNNNISIIFNAEEGSFKSKNSRKRMKEELKKSFKILEDKEDFLLIPNDKTGYFIRFLNDNFKFDIVKNKELEYNVNIFLDKEKVELQKLENEKDKKRDQLKKKLHLLKDRRSNKTGRRMKEIQKSMGDDMLQKFVKAQQSMGDNQIPDPQEIMKNKDKYIQQFKEYQTMIANMKNSNPEMSKMLESNPYHKYASAIIDKLNI